MMMKLIIGTFAILGVVFLKKAEGKVYKVHNNVDCPGWDIQGLNPAMGIIKAEVCLQMCDTMPTCKAFTYISNNRCYVKTVCARKAAKNSHYSYVAIEATAQVSGYDKYAKLNCMGSDSLSPPHYKQMSTVGECLSYCTTRSDCKGVVYKPNRCYPKSRCNAMVEDQGADSYVKTEAAVKTEEKPGGCSEKKLVLFEDCATKCAKLTREADKEELETAVDHSDCMVACYQSQQPQVLPGSLKDESVLDMSECGTECYRQFLTDISSSSDRCEEAETVYRYNRCFASCLKKVTEDNSSRGKRDLRLRRANDDHSLSHDRVVYLDCYVDCVACYGADCVKSPVCGVVDFAQAQLCNSRCLTKVQAMSPPSRKKRAINQTLTQLNVKNTHCIADCLVEDEHDECLIIELEAVKTCFNKCVLA